MNLTSEQLPEQPVAPPPRTKWIFLIALAQGLICWAIPKAWLVAVFPPLIAAPMAFYLSERYLPRRPWLPSLFITLFWLPGLCYPYPMVGGKYLGSAAFATNCHVYWAFCFFSLPFVQTFAERGGRGLRRITFPAGRITVLAAEFSARMNRNLTLGLLGVLALMPVCLALAFVISNIDFNAWCVTVSKGWGSISVFFYSTVVPLPFVGIVNWVQINMKKQAVHECTVLPFLRKTMGRFSGWVAVAAGMTMAGILLSFCVFGSNAPDRASFLSLMPAAFFWTASSINVREGRWEEKIPLFRNILTICTLIFPLYMLWCAGMVWRTLEPGTTLYISGYAFCTWRNMCLGILLLASMGHGLAVCSRRWPAWVPSVNVGVHLCILLLLLLTRSPVADPVRYDAEFIAAKLIANPLNDRSYLYYSQLEKSYGPYGTYALDRALVQMDAKLGPELNAKSGAELDAEPGAEVDPEKSRRKAAWKSIQARIEKQRSDSRLVKLRATFAAMHRMPEDEVVPERFLRWLADFKNEDYDAFLKPQKGQHFLLKDINRDGEPEIILLDVAKEQGNMFAFVFDKEKGWTLSARLHFDKKTAPPLSVAIESPSWDELVINGESIRLK